MQFIVQGYPAYAYTGGVEPDMKLPTVVFVHGAAFDHSVWQWQSRYFAHHGFNALAIDLPGHGRSGGSPAASVEEIAEWIGALLDVIGARDATLVGHSMGALASEIPGAKFVALNAGHSMMSEAPKELLGALRDFLR